MKDIVLCPKKWFNELIIRNKIIAIFFPLIVIPLCILGFITNQIFTNSIIEKTKNSILDSSKLITTRINIMLDNAENCSSFLMSDINRVTEYNEVNLKLLEYTSENKVVFLQYSEQIQSLLKFAKITFPDIDSVFYIDSYSNIFSSENGMIYNLNEIHDSGILNKIERTNGSSLWCPMQQRKYMVRDPSKPVLTLGRKIIRISNQEKLGTLFINISENTISSAYSSIKKTKTGGYFIVDSKGMIVSSLKKGDILKFIPKKNLQSHDLLSGTPNIVAKNSGNIISTSIEINKTDWSLVNEISLEELTADTRKNSLVVVIIGLICIILAIMGTGLLSKAISKPLVNLTKTVLMTKEGNLDVKFNVGSSDEVGILASGFNTMVGEIRDLLEKVKLEQKKKREFELALIQSQIKPHFFYNTLDVIYSLAKMGRIEGVLNATKSLADFYRVALSKGREIIPISEEISHVKAYLTIQKIRYADIFDYEVDIDADIFNYDILKLTIQPLVENAIYHGLKSKGEKGRIIVKGYKEEGTIHIKVIDDGVGMSKERIEGIYRQDDNSFEPLKSFGLINVDERVKLYFGENYGINIISEEGKGTEVSIKLPL